MEFLNGLFFLHVHGSDILDMKSPVNFSADRLDPFVVLKKMKISPFSALISSKGAKRAIT